MLHFNRKECIINAFVCKGGDNMGLSEKKMKEIENKAEDLFKRINYDYNDKEAIDVIHIAKQLGFQVGIALLDKDEDGFIIVQEGEEEILGIKTDKLIGVNADRELKWKRFIIAHELAHFILHCNESIYAHRDHRKGKNSTENEADYFAANILMPKSKFKKAYNELGKIEYNKNVKVSLLSEMFIVTEKMIQRRIEELGLE